MSYKCEKKIIPISESNIYIYSAPEDYVSRIEVLVTFTAGETEQFVEVLLVDDNVVEGEEVFSATLTLPAGSSGVALGQNSEATATITDDDGMPLATT